MHVEPRQSMGKIKAVINPDDEVSSAIAAACDIAGLEPEAFSPPKEEAGLRIIIQQLAKPLGSDRW